MLYYLKKYPISLTIIAVVIYLSFFKPPSLEVGKNRGDRQSGSSLYVCRLVRYAVDRVPAQPLQIRRCVVACLDWSGLMSGLDERSNRTFAGILYDIPWWRLVRFPREYLRCYSRYAVFLLRPPSLDNEEKDWYSLVYVFIHLLWDYRQDPDHLMNLIEEVD